MIRDDSNAVNERGSVLASDAVPVDITAVDSNARAEPLTTEVGPRHVDHDEVHELRSTLRAHRGDTRLPIVVRSRNRRTRPAVDDYPRLVGELTDLRGTRVLPVTRR